MANRGRKPTPAALKKLLGNPGQRPINEEEPTPSRKRPKCPVWLRPEAKHKWRRLIEMLDSAGVLTEIDGGAMARYCASWARWREAEEFLDTNGSVYTVTRPDKTRIVRRFPQVGIVTQCMVELSSLEAKFGMSPADRTKIRKEPGDRVDEFEEFVSQGGIVGKIG